MLPVDDNRILVYIARHGVTVLNQDDCFRGPLNPPLAPEGIKDAHTLGFYLSPIKFSFIFSSDKTRAMQTAKIISQAQDRDQEVIPKESLRALNVGWFGGKPKEQYTDDLMYYIHNPQITIPQGESLNDFRARIRPLFVEATEVALQYQNPVLLVAHSSIIHEAGKMYNGSNTSSLVHPGGLAAIYMDKDSLHCEPIFKPNLEKNKKKADTVS